MIAPAHTPIRDAWNKAVRVPKIQSSWVWAENNIHISRRTGAPFPGMYDTSLTPYAREWFDVWDDPNYHEMTTKKGAQIGGTQAAYCCILFSVCNDPDPGLVIMPGADEVKEVSKLRIIPLIEDSPTVAEELTANPDDITHHDYKFRQCFWRLIGSNSPSKLASFPHRFIIYDETDKYKGTIGVEGSVTGLGGQRQNLFWNWFSWKISTPTVPEGYIQRHYKRGDQRQARLPCPNCGGPNSFRWNPNKPAMEEGNQIHWEDNNPATAHLLCRHCETKIFDDGKAEMVANMHWEKTAKPKAKGHASFHAPGLLSPSIKLTFEAAVAKWLSVEGDEADVIDFINGSMGECYEAKPVIDISTESIKKIRDTVRFPRFTIPTPLPVRLLTLCDIQQSYCVYSVWANGPQDAWMVDHGTISVPDDLEDIAEIPFLNEADEEYRIHGEIVDTGYRTAEAYTYCMTHPNAIPIKGDTGDQTRQGAPIRTDDIRQ